MEVKKIPIAINIKSSKTKSNEQVKQVGQHEKDKNKILPIPPKLNITLNHNFAIGPISNTKKINTVKIPETKTTDDTKSIVDTKTVKSLPDANNNPEKKIQPPKSISNLAGPSNLKGTNIPMGGNKKIQTNISNPASLSSATHDGNNSYDDPDMDTSSSSSSFIKNVPVETVVVYLAPFVAISLFVMMMWVFKRKKSTSGRIGSMIKKRRKSTIDIIDNSMTPTINQVHLENSLCDNSEINDDKLFQLGNLKSINSGLSSIEDSSIIYENSIIVDGSEVNDNGRLGIINNKVDGKSLISSSNKSDDYEIPIYNLGDSNSIGEECKTKSKIMNESTQLFKNDNRNKNNEGSISNKSNKSKNSIIKLLTGNSNKKKFEIKNNKRNKYKKPISVVVLENQTELPSIENTQYTFNNNNINTINNLNHLNNNNQKDYSNIIPLQKAVINNKSPRYDIKYYNINNNNNSSMMSSTKGTNDTEKTMLNNTNGNSATTSNGRGVNTKQNDGILLTADSETTMITSLNENINSPNHNNNNPYNKYQKYQKNNNSFINNEFSIAIDSGGGGSRNSVKFKDQLDEYSFNKYVNNSNISEKEKENSNPIINEKELFCYKVW